MDISQWPGADVCWHVREMWALRAVEIDDQMLLVTSVLNTQQRARHRSVCACRHAHYFLHDYVLVQTFLTHTHIY